jgi:hypothetical protein
VVEIVVPISHTEFRLQVDIAVGTIHAITRYRVDAIAVVRAVLAVGDAEICIGFP